MRIGHRAHNTSHRKAVEIVIDKDKHTQKESRQLRPYARLDMHTRPSSERRTAARFIYQSNNYSQNYQEQIYSGGIGNSGNQAFV